MGRHGENIRKRKDGRWEARVIGSYDLNGKAKYLYLYGKSYSEVKGKRNALLGDLRAGSGIINECQDKMRITVTQLMWEWMLSRKDTIKESTFARYVNLLEKHILPELGHYCLSAVTADLLDTYLKKELKKGRLDGRGGLSPKTVTDIRSVLLMGIEYANEKGYPCRVNSKVFYPKSVKKNICVLSRIEQSRLEHVLFSDADPVNLGILVALYGGLRIGEVCALQWGSFNFENGTVNINRTVLRICDFTPNSPKKTKVLIDTPKTVCSIREIPLPSFVLEYLVKFKGERETYLLTGTKEFMEPRICLDKYKKVLRRAGVEEYTFHTLRHTFATRCVESGFDVKSLSEILGHANINTTMQRYVHPSVEMKRAQMERLKTISIYSQNCSHI